MRYFLYSTIFISVSKVDNKYHGNRKLINVDKDVRIQNS